MKFSLSHLMLTVLAASFSIGWYVSRCEQIELKRLIKKMEMDRASLFLKAAEFGQRQAKVFPDDAEGPSGIESPGLDPDPDPLTDVEERELQAAELLVLAVNLESELMDAIELQTPGLGAAVFEELTTITWINANKPSYERLLSVLNRSEVEISAPKRLQNLVEKLSSNKK